MASDDSKGNDKLLFYCADLCPFAQRAWIALEEKGAEYEYKETSLVFKWEDMLKITGAVPCGRHQGLELKESLPFCFYVDAAFKGPSLMPADPKLQFRAHLLIQKFDQTLVKPFYGFLMEQDPEAQKTKGAALERVLQSINDDIKLPYALGDQFTLVDCALIPFLERAQALLPKYRNWSIPESLTTLHQYMKNAWDRPSVKATRRDRQQASIDLKPWYKETERTKYLQEVYSTYAAGKLGTFKKDTAAKHKAPPGTVPPA